MSIIPRKIWLLSFCEALVNLLLPEFSPESSVSVLWSLTLWPSYWNFLLGENPSQLGYMLIHCLAKDDDIININQTPLPLQSSWDSFHEWFFHHTGSDTNFLEHLPCRAGGEGKLPAEIKVCVFPKCLPSKHKYRLCLACLILFASLTTVANKSSDNKLFVQ